jgi:raffinose/stachyose/melibiose transport system substrate-binding protein
MKRYRMLIGAAVIVALALAAYFSGLYRQPEEPENQTPAKVTLEFYQQREEAIASFTAVIARFADTQPGVVIYQRNVPNAQEMLVARIRSGDVPDVFTDWPTQRNFTSIVAEKAVTDLTDQPFMAKVSPRALDMTRSRDGRIYALPLNYNCMEVYYNTELFSRLGVSEPKTIPELLSLCDTMVADGTLPLIFCIRDYGRMAHIAQMILAVTVEDYLDKLSALADGTMTAEARTKHIIVKMHPNL